MATTSNIPQAGAISSSGSINRGESSIKNAGAIGKLGATGGSSGAVNRGASSIKNAGSIGKLGTQKGDSGSINRGESSIKNAGAVGKVGERGGDSGSINRGTSTIKNAGAIGKLGTQKGDSGSINRGASTIKNSGAIGNLGERGGDSGAINRGASTIKSSGAIGRLGDRGGSSGAINRGASTIKNVSSGGGSLRSGGAGSSGGIRGGSGGSSLRGGSKKVGGGKPSRSKPKRVPVFRHIYCGTPVTGSFIVDVEQSFDPVTGLPLADKVIQFKADINGVTWTPEDYRDHMPDTYYMVGDSEDDTDTRISRITTGAWSPNCLVKMDAPDPDGKILASQEVTLDIPNASTTTGSGWEEVSTPNPGPEHAITNARSGTGVYPESMIYLP